MCELTLIYYTLFAENDSKQITKERKGKMYGKTTEFI